MNILITGASGLLGAALMPALAGVGHHVVPLRRSTPGRGPSWNPAAGQIDLASEDPFEAVIHLSGETVAQRWTASVKERMRQSRVDSTRLLCETLVQLPQPPRVLLCASATGLYGDRGDEWLDESSPAGHGFLAGLSQEWEAAAEPARASGLRVVHLRLGIVLSRRGGALAKMLPAFRFGLGGPIGDGRQYWSWIAMDDVLAVVERALVEDWRGPINVVAPGPVTSREFARVLARVLRRPAFLSVPRFAVKLIFGEMGREALLGSARVRPAFLLEHGFQFRLGTLEQALLAEIRTAGD